MKPITLYLILIVSLLASCKKEHQSTVKTNVSTAKKFPVSFTVSQFAQTTGNIDMQRALKSLAQKRNLAASVVDTSAFAQAVFEYFYLVYDSSGNEVKRIYRNAAAPGFVTKFQFVGNDPIRDISFMADSDPYNVITDSLAAGTYTVAIAGAAYSEYNRLDVDYWDADITDPTYSPLATAAVYAGQGLDAIPRSMDIFFSKSTLTVTGTTTANAITLHRIVGEVEVDLKDAVIPNNVSFIILGRLGEIIGYSIANEIPNNIITGYSSDQVYTADDDYTNLAAADYTKGTYIMQRFVLNTLTPIDILINAYDKDGNLIASKTVPQVQIQQNRRTVLTGKLFDNSVPAQFTITANVAWGPDTSPITFLKR